MNSIEMTHAKKKHPLKARRSGKAVGTLSGEGGDEDTYVKVGYFDETEYNPREHGREFFLAFVRDCDQARDIVYWEVARQTDCPAHHAKRLTAGGIVEWKNG